MADIIKKDRYVYFLFSEQQEEENKKLEKERDSNYIPGKVIVNGRRRLFTEISIKPNNRYDDTVLVAEGYESKMTYTPVYRTGSTRR